MRTTHQHQHSPPSPPPHHHHLHHCHKLFLKSVLVEALQENWHYSNCSKANGGQEQGNIKAKGQANHIEGIMIKGNGCQLKRGLY